MARGQGEYSVWNRQEALRLQRQSAAAEKAAERQRRLRETEDGKASAERLNEDLTGRVGRLESILRRGLDREVRCRLECVLHTEMADHATGYSPVHAHFIELEISHLLEKVPFLVLAQHDGR